MAYTLSIDELVSEVLDRFHIRVPALQLFSTDLSTQTAVLGDTIRASIVGNPTTSTYDAANGGYANGAQDGKGLLQDVPVVVDKLTTVPIVLNYTDSLAAKRNLEMAFAGQADALGTAVVNHAISKIVAASFAQTAVVAPASVSADAVRAATDTLNLAGAAPSGRVGIVNTAFASRLSSDPVVSSGDYNNQRPGGNAYRDLTNLEGFERIIEYPGLPDNGENLSAFFGTRQSVVIAGAVPAKLDGSDAAVNEIHDVTTMTHPETGITISGIEWVEPGTLNHYHVLAVLHGAAAGNQAGGDEITGKSGYRVTSA